MKSHHAALPQSENLIVVKDVTIQKDSAAGQVDNYATVRPVRRGGSLGTADPQVAAPAPAPVPEKYPQAPGKYPPAPEKYGYMRLDPRTSYVLPFAAL